MAQKKILSLRIDELEEISKNVYSLRFRSEELRNAKCGQFVNVYLDDHQHLLPRPISIADMNDDEMHLVFQIAGDGTRIMSEKRPGDMIRVSTPLGNGYDISSLKKGDRVILFGGGIGVPPLVYLAKTLKKMDIDVTCIFGYRSDTFLIKELEEMGIDVRVTTDDGSHGYHGNVLDYFRESGLKAEWYYACGPRIMLKKLAEYLHEHDEYVYVSMEERMGCGYGACVGCAIDVLNDNNETVRLKVCKDGPVFDSRKVVWK